MAKIVIEPGDQPAELIRSNIFEDATVKIQDATSQIQEVYADLKAEVDKFETERDNFMEISKKLDSVHFPPIIRLNVGGQIYQTTMDTLKKDPNSMLAVMFSGRFDISKDENGAYFIDRDGELFRYVLNFLRIGKLQTKRLPEIKDELLTEAEFYQIQGLIELLTPGSPALPVLPIIKLLTPGSPALPVLPIIKFKDSKIMKDEFRKHFIDWLPKDQLEWKLIYSGTNNGWTAEDFHRCCDGKSPTITLAQAKSSGYIFGGYTDQPWQSGRSWILSNRNFLFSMVNARGICPVKFLAKDQQGATYHRTDFGPSFGGNRSEFDLYISDKANTTEYSYSKLGHGNGYVSASYDNSFLAGSESFTLFELEVFSLDI